MSMRIPTDELPSFSVRPMDSHARGYVRGRRYRLELQLNSLDIVITGKLVKDIEYNDFIP